MDLDELREKLAKQSWDKKTWMELQLEHMYEIRACCPIDGRLYCFDGLEQDLQEIELK